MLYQIQFLRFISYMQSSSRKIGERGGWFAVLAGLLIGFAAVPFEAEAQADYKRYYDEDNLPKVR